MKPELERVRGDLETMQKAMGMAPSFGRDWIHWLRRDNWLSLWWFLPGAILMASALLPADSTQRYLGLLPNQWVGVLVTAVLLGMLFFWNRAVTRRGARPDGLVREYQKINKQSGWFFLAFAVQITGYFIWTNQHHLSGGAVMSGLWMLCGSSLLMVAVLSKLWVFVGWAIPLIAFGLCEPLMDHKSGGLWLGLLFFAGALLSSFIQAWQLRLMEKQHDAL